MGSLLHEDLTRQIIGIAFKVYNAIGYGVREQYIHRAFAQEFRSAGILFEHEVVIPLTYNGECIGTYRIDFIVGATVVVELKVVPFVKHVHVKQVLEYLRSLDKEARKNKLCKSRPAFGQISPIRPSETGGVAALQ